MACVAEHGSTGSAGHLAAASKLLVSGAEENVVARFLEVAQTVKDAVILQPVGAAALRQLLRTAQQGFML